jgi:hypothetical protein
MKGNVDIIYSIVRVSDFISQFNPRIIKKTQIENCMKITYALITGFILLQSIYSENILTGIIIDGENKLPLAQANIYIEGTYIGTISNDQGLYALEIPKIPSMLIISYIGYETEKIVIEKPGKIKLDVGLKPLVFQGETIIVSGSDEDPAIAIMKKVIRRKLDWRRRFESYRAKAYTRTLAANDTTIMSLSESISIIRWHKEIGSSEEFFTKTSAKQMSYLTEMNVGSKNIINLYEDDIDIFNHLFIGPTHPDALSYYHFELTGERNLDQRRVFDIKVSPKTRLQPMFVGTVAVLDNEFAMISADLSIHQHIHFSEMIPTFMGNYRQQFSNFGKEFWLLIDSRSDERAIVDMGLLAFPQVTFKKISRISNYEINIDVSDEMARVDSINQTEQEISAHMDAYQKFEKVPLTERELNLIINPDTSLTLLKAFRPSGILAPYLLSKEDELESSLRSHSNYTPLTSNARYGFQGWLNRVEGLNLGASCQKTFQSRYQIDITAGYQTARKRFYYQPQMNYLINKKDAHKYLFFGFYKRIEPTYSSELYSQLALSLLPLFGRDDYFNYYQNKSIYTGIHHELARFNSNWIVNLNFSEHTSVEKKSNRMLFGKKFIQRDNPAIDDGRMNTIQFCYKYDEHYGIPAIARLGDLYSYNQVKLEIEYSSSKFLGSDFDFAQYRLLMDYTFKTFFKRRPDSQYIRNRLTTSTFSGSLPLQRFECIDGNLYGYAPFGVFKTVVNRPLVGEKKVAYFWEYNFKSIPFEALGLSYFARNKYELIIHGAGGRWWIDESRWQGSSNVSMPMYEKRTHYEAGMALKVKYKFIAVRLDLTQNINTRQTYLGFSAKLIGLTF